jgi:WD40 repeat protein
MGTNETTAHLSGHQGAIYDAAWDPSTQTWLTAGGDGIVAEWNADGSGEGRALLHHDKAFFSIGCLSNMRAAGAENGELFTWTGNEPESVTRMEAHSNGLFALAWSPSSGLLTGGGDERIAMWIDAEHQFEWRLPGAQKIRCLVHSPTSLFIGTTSGKAYLCEHLEPGRSIQNAVEINGHEGGCYAAVWLPQKKAWLSTGRDGHIRAWTPTGEEILSIPAHEGAIYRMASDGTILWTASRDKTLKAWKANDLTFIRKITRRDGGSARSINALACRAEGSSPTSNALLYGGDDRIGRLLTY